MKKAKAVRFKIIRYIAISILLFVGFLMARQIEWQGDKSLHTIMEVIATLLALMVGILALIRYYAEKTRQFLFIGTGFLGTALLDAYHAIVTSAFFDLHFPSPPDSLIPWSWVASRLFLSLLMLLSFWAASEEQSENPKAGVRLSDWVVFSAGAGVTLAIFFFFAFYTLPRAYYPEYAFGRPEEFIPAFFFLLALLGYLKKGDWKDDPFEDWVVASLIVGVMGQVMFMSFSFRLFDTMFDAAHLLKKLSYICMMQGLLLSIFLLVKTSEVGRTKSEAGRLEAEIGRLESESIVEASPNGMLMVSAADGEIRLVNAVVERIFGYARIELIGKPIENLIPKRFRSRHGGHIASFIQSPQNRRMGEGLPEMILFGLRKDGSEVPLEIGLGHIKNEKGMFILVVLTDISDRRAIEENLASERKALEKVNLELDSFVYTASHDLRAPLRGINSFSKFIEEDYSDHLDDEGRDHLRRIRNGVSRMTRLIDDLLALSRISRQKNPYESVKIETVIRSVKERLEFDIEDPQVDLVVQEGLPVICCDRTKITEVFLNLINNAIKFSQKKNGDGSAEAETGRIKVKVGYAEKNGDYQFSVKDKGIGIDPKYHEKIFGIFQRLHTRGEYEGTGAGLSIVKRVIDDHQGRIWIDSALGKGATFYFTIPKKIEEA